MQRTDRIDCNLATPPLEFSFEREGGDRRIELADDTGKKELVQSVD